MRKYSQPIYFLSRCFLLSIAASCTDWISLSFAQEPQNYNAEQIGPWDLAELQKTPAMRWESQTGAVRSLLYAGENFDGHPTEVFAFYASPATLGEANAMNDFRVSY